MAPQLSPAAGRLPFVLCGNIAECMFNYLFPYSLQQETLFCQVVGGKFPNSQTLERPWRDMEDSENIKLWDDRHLAVLGLIAKPWKGIPALTKTEMSLLLSLLSLPKD